MQPQKYERTTDFTERDGDDTDHASINAEFDAAASSINQIRTNLAQIQRDDGALKNGIVTADSLAPSAFDAVLVNVNEAVVDAQDSATSALTSATTALGARDAAIAAKTTTESARDVTILNANNASASALAASNSQAAAAASQSSASASQSAAASSQTAAAASATSAATSATTATTQAGIATTKAADAAASATASASSAAGSQTAKTAAETARDAAQTARSGSEAARDTSVAAKDAAQVSQSAAASSASSAGTSATTATTKAAEASASATSAATSATTATTQATTATTKATEAAASAASALASKNAAAASEAAAAASQVSAANSAAAAATALDNFDDRYLGPKASDPTLDNDGNALTDGALYSNTTTKKMRIYFDAYGWIDASSASVATLVTYEFVATTANQTTFTGNDANGVLLSYTVGSEVVIGNGAKLKRGVDYTASTGSSIVLTEGVGVGQEISVLAFGSFLVANTYMKSEADALFVKKTNITAGKVIGRDTSGAGNAQELPIAVDNAGNVGVGTIPNTWYATPGYGQALELGKSSALWDYNNAGNTQTRLYHNAYLSSSGADIYKTNGYALRYMLANGLHEWAVANSGSAGGTVTWRDAMRLANSGQLFTVIDGTSTVMASYGCRAWVNFNGTGTVAIRGSGNVSSITDNGVGNYYMNFATAMPDANYSMVGTCQYYLAGTASGWQTVYNLGTPNSSVCQIGTGSSASGTDCNWVNVSVFR